MHRKTENRKRNNRKQETGNGKQETGNGTTGNIRSENEAGNVPTKIRKQETGHMK